MQATLNGNGSSYRSASLLKIGEVANRLGVSVGSIRNWVQDGTIEAVRSPGGHRLIPESAVRSFLGFDEQSEIQEEGIPVCLCGRVSTFKQSKARGKSEASDLDRQTDKLREWVKANHPNARVTEYVAVRSGLNFSDKTFVRMLEDILEGKFRGGLLVCTHRDRVCRLSGEFLSLICKKGECELVEIDEEMERSFSESIADELLALTHVFSCRHYARRSAERNTKYCSEGAIERMRELRGANVGIDSIVRILKEEGFRMGKGQDPEGWDEPITEWVVLRMLEGVSKGFANEGQNQDLLDEFLQECVERTENKSDRITNAEMQEAYGRFCERKGVVPEERSVLGHKLVAKGLARKRTNKERFWFGVKLTT